MSFDDNKSRSIIVDSLDKNYFVEASAGSGKTSSLVLRMVALVEAGVPVDKICTITFTKVAANEFFSRFQNLLSIRSSNVPDSSDKFLPPRTEESIKYCEEALNNIDACFLGTIDAFLNMVAHELPNEIKIPSDATVVSKEERNAYIKKEYNNIVCDPSHPLYKWAIKFNNLFLYPYDSFVVGIDELNNKRGMDTPYEKNLLDIDLDEFLKDEKIEFLEFAKYLCAANVNFFKGGISEKNRERQTDYNKAKTLFDNIYSKSWNDVLADVCVFIRNVKGLEFPKEEVSGTALESKDYISIGPRSKNYKYTDYTIEIINKVVTKIDRYKNTLYFHVVLSAIEDINYKLKQLGKFDYFDYLYYVTQQFKISAQTDRELVDHVYERHSYFLIDESQDTDPLQTELFFYITGTKRTKDWIDVEPREKSLFIVGDPKQSIYGFKGASVQSYLKTKESFNKKKEVLFLTRNFRSIPCLKKWFNFSMNYVLNDGKAESIYHHPIPVSDEEVKLEAKATLLPGKIGLKGVYKYDMDCKADPLYTAGIIQELVENNTYQILVKNSKGEFVYRDIKYSDFLIVPRTTRVNDYIDEFNKRGIPLIVEAQIPFVQSQSLVALVIIAKLLKNPNNRQFYLDVLYGFYHLNDADIISLINSGFNFDVGDKENIARVGSNYLHIFSLLYNLFEDTKDLSFSSTLVYILNDKRLSLLTSLDSSNLEYTHFLIEKVREQEIGGGLSSVYLFNELLDSYISNGVEDNRVLRFKDEVDRVKIANLHKVKGLQAPIVILAKPKEGKRKVTSYVDYSSIPPKACYNEITKTGDHGEQLTVTASHMYSQADLDEWNERAEAERNRLAYVGATRAESVLIVSNDSKCEQDNPWKKLVDCITEECSLPQIDIKNVESTFTKDACYQASDINKECHKQTIFFHTPSNNVVYRPISNDDELGEYEADNKRIDKENSTLIGTIVHKVLECIVKSKNSYQNATILVKTIISKYENASIYKDLLVNIARTFVRGGFQQKNSILDNDLFAILSKAKEVYTEMPFSYKKGDTIITGTMDLVYKDDGGYHIIDYKTNAEDDVAKLEKEYEKQLCDYIEALKEVGINADAHIYHIDV